MRRSSIARDGFVHKVQLRIVTGVTAKFSVMGLQVLHTAARLTAKAIAAQDILAESAVRL